MKRFLVIIVHLSSSRLPARRRGRLDSWHSGGADTVSGERELPPFNRVAIEGFADVTLVQGSAESASPSKARRTTCAASNST